MILSLQQIVLILETPLGDYERYSDVEVVKHRRRIQQLYSQFKHDSSFSQASELARIAWLHEAQQNGLVWC